MGFVLTAALALLSALAGVAAETAVRVDREAIIMGARLRVEVEAESEDFARRVIDRAFQAVLELESRWAVSAAGSELAGLRQADLGSPVSLSAETFELLSQAWYLADRTDGAFEPAIGPLLEAWSVGNADRSPAEADLQRALGSVGRSCFDLSPATRTIARYCPDAWIDGGGLEKGAALAVIEHILEEEGIDMARVAFGGRILVRGSALTAQEPIEIAYPRGDRGVAFHLPASDGSLATTSQAGAWQTGAGGARATVDGLRGRIVDSRTGFPVEEWGSVTVRSEDPVEADALSRALFVMGPEEGIRWLAARPEVEAVFLVSSERGVTACGRESLVDALLPQGPGARISDAPLIASGLRACALPS